MHAAAILCQLAAAVVLTAGSTTVSPPVQSPDFTGTWVLDVAASDFGRSQPADSGVTIITRADDRLVMSRRTYVSMRHGGEVTFDLPTDGTEHEGIGSDGKPFPAAAQWSGETLVVIITGESNVGPMDIVDYMTVDGDTMRIERSVEIASAQGLTQGLNQSLVLRRGN
jgi:hypothetical protein